jgi:hypothetical protein
MCCLPTRPYEESLTACCSDVSEKAAMQARSRQKKIQGITVTGRGKIRCPELNGDATGAWLALSVLPVARRVASALPRRLVDISPRRTSELHREI